MPFFYTFETIIHNATAWSKTASGYVVTWNDDCNVVRSEFTREELTVEGNTLVNALDTLSALYTDTAVAEYLVYVEAAHRLLPTQLFDEQNPKRGCTWSKWTYFKEAPRSALDEITLMYEMHDGIITVPVTLPATVWRLCYPDVMNRYEVAKAMGMDSREVAEYCTPKEKPIAQVELPTSFTP